MAVLIGKALVEIPPKFALKPPVNPKDRAEAANGQVRAWKGAQGLAEDVRYYGQWMRDEAEKRIGHLYPKATLPDGSKATVIAWLWARTVRSPDPAAKAAMVPLVSSFMLSTKEGAKAWVEPIIDAAAPDGWRFEVKTGTLPKTAEAKLNEGTKTSRGNFECLLTGTPIPDDYNRAEGNAGRLGERLIALVAQKDRARVFIDAKSSDEELASSASPEWEPEGDLFPKAIGARVPAYGLTRWADQYTRRQLTALATFSDLVDAARDRVENAALAFGLENGSRLHEGGTGAAAYADAVATYLALASSKLSMFATTQSRWRAGEAKTAPGYGRQAISMVWDHAEINPFAGAGGDFAEIVGGGSRAFAAQLGGGPSNRVGNVDARNQAESNVIISTDPPYYDNIGYADLSDHFYVWLRPSLRTVWPDLFRRVLTPKDDELVATPGRHGGRAQAEKFFMEGISAALKAMSTSSQDRVPLTIYYAFKQSEVTETGISSAGWASFLQGVVDAALVVDGTWPLRTEGATRLRGQASNALASSVVLVCRKRTPNADVITRADFMRTLKREMPAAIDAIRKAGVGPVDMQQSVIGPGMGVFSRHAKVLEDDDSTMTVKTALALINRVWEEIENELDQAFDAETQVALAWFATYGFDARASGELITLTTAKNTSDRALFASGVFKDMKGKAGLTPREELPPGWSPAGDKTLTTWECVQHTARVLNAPDGGGEAAAALVAQMGPKAEEARALAYRLFEIATNKGWAAEALVYNELAQEWSKLEDVAATLDDAGRALGSNQTAFAFEGTA